MKVTADFKTLQGTARIQCAIPLFFILVFPYSLPPPSPHCVGAMCKFVHLLTNLQLCQTCHIFCYEISLNSPLLCTQNPACMSGGVLKATEVFPILKITHYSAVPPYFQYMQNLCSLKNLYKRFFCSLFLYNYNIVYNSEGQNYIHNIFHTYLIIYMLHPHKLYNQRFVDN